MSATILTFAPRRPEPDELRAGAAGSFDRLMREPLCTAASTGPTPRQIAHRWAMLAHLKRREESDAPDTVR